MQIAAQLRIAALSPDTVDESDPQSPRLRAAIAHLEAHEYDAALTRLAEILKVDPDWQDGRARQLMIDVFGLPDIDPPTAALWRRRLATLLN